mgnify:FL=1
MPSRDLKDQMQAPVEQFGTSTMPTTQGSIQLKLSPSMSRTIVDIVLDDLEKAKRDRDEREYGRNDKGENFSYEKWIKEIERLYTGKRENKVVPWKFCSNRSMRIGTAILEMLHSRLFSGVWNADLTRWRPGELTDVPKVKRITDFMTWWVKVWSPMRDFFDNWVKHTAGYGDSVTELSWEVEEYDTGQVQEIPVTDESGMPLTNQDGTPAISQVPTITRFEKSKARIIPKSAIYLMKGARDIQKDTVPIEEEFLYKDLLEMEKNGQAINISTELASFLPISYPEGIGDPVERERIKQVKLRNIQVRTIRWYGHFDIEGTGFNESVRIMIAPDFHLYLGGIKMKDVTKSGKRPLDYTKYSSYLQMLDEMFGEGVLDQVRELSDEIDAIFNQMTDANTLSVLRPGFYDPSGDVDAKAMKIAPNIMHPVTDPSHNVFFPDFQINTDRLINAIRLILEFIERLTAASSYVMGKESEIVGGSGTATRTTAILQSAEIRFTRPVERLRDGASRILTRLLDIVQLNIPPGMETRVMGEDNEPIFVPGELSSEGVSGQYDAYLLSDPTLGSKEMDRQVSAMMYQALLGNPLVGTDPIKIYRVTAKLLESVGWEPEEILGPEPLMDDIDDPEDENTLMIQGDFNRVKANLVENHIYHIQKHMELMQSPSLQLLGQQAPNLVQQVVQYNQFHIQEHQQMLQAMLALLTKAGGGGGGTSSEPGENGSASSNGKEPGMGGGTSPLDQVMQSKKAGVPQIPS